MTSLPDSGNREYVATGGMREPATGKGRYDLLSPAVLKRVAQHYENGAEKYAARNWEKGLPDSRCFDSAVRHLYTWLEGDKSEDHLAAAIWNISALIFNETYFAKNGVVHDLKMWWRKKNETNKHRTGTSATSYAESRDGNVSHTSGGVTPVLQDLCKKL